MAPNDALLDARETLLAEVATHKRAIHQHRRALRRAASSLVEVEAQCQRLGIKFVRVITPGVGGIHGQSDESPESTD